MNDWFLLAWVFFLINFLLSSQQNAFHNGLATSDALLNVSHVLQGALEGGSDASFLQIDFCTAFEHVNQSQPLFMLRSIGVTGSLFSVIGQFLSNRKHYVVVDGRKSFLMDVISDVSKGSVLGPFLFMLYNADVFLIL